jgi:hypothetical protein
LISKQLRHALDSMIPCPRKHLFEEYYGGPLFRVGRLVATEDARQLIEVPQTSYNLGGWFWMELNGNDVVNVEFLDGLEQERLALGYVCDLPLFVRQDLAERLNGATTVADVFSHSTDGRTHLPTHHTTMERRENDEKRLFWIHTDSYPVKEVVRGRRRGFVELVVTHDEAILTARILSPEEAVAVLLNLRPQPTMREPSSVKALVHGQEEAWWLQACAAIHLHNFGDWEDFVHLVDTLTSNKYYAKALRRIDGPDMRLFEFELHKTQFALVCDDPYGHELLTKNSEDMPLLRAIASQLDNRW